MPTVPLVSIVTPAYNEETYLSECIESVLSQTYTSWEYTIVDNASTDRTLAIAREYAKTDSRIRVITNPETIPALANLNLAMRQISPESQYCKMVLADDWIFPECLQRMVAVASEYPSVGIVGAYGLVNPWVLWTGLPYPSHFTAGREVCRQKLFGGPYVFGSPTSLLFRADLVRTHDPFFNESNVQADSEVCFELLKTSDFGFVHQVLTFVRERPKSRMEALRKLNTAAAGTLHELLQYGPFYLSAEEYKECLRVSVDKYYDFLATSCFQNKDANFWSFHKQKLKEKGFDFKYRSLLSGMIRKTMRKFRGPGDNEPIWGL